MTAPPAARRRGAERTRTLEPLPPDAAGSRHPFARSWWGQAWLRSLEDAALDDARLARGRTYARRGAVGAVTATPGQVTAYVQGSRPRPYRAGIRLPELTDEEWEAFLDAVAADPAHIAALLDHDMPETLTEAGAATGLALLPAGDDLRPHCSCPDDGYPCKHAAALCYQMARFLDSDPFVLLLLRGRGENELIEALARRNAAHAADRLHTVALPTLPAQQVLVDQSRPPLPDPLPVPAVPGLPRAFPPDPAAPAAPSGGSRPRRRTAPLPGPTDPEALDFLATDAAVRAHGYLTGAASGPLGEPSAWRDAVRLAAGHPHLTGRGAFSPAFAHLAEGAGGTVTDLTRAAAAWRHGGPAGLDTLDEPWDPPAGEFDRGRSALSSAGFPGMSIDRNRLTAAGVQLRYGRDGLWYPYCSEAEPAGFWPAGAPSQDPLPALRTALHD